MASLCKKRLCKPWASVARRIDFSSAMESEEDGSFFGDADTSDEETLFEYVYEYLLEAIVSSQIARISSPESDSDGFKTSTSSLPRLNGVAETCPSAPTGLLKSEVIGLSPLGGTGAQLVTPKHYWISRGYR